MGRLLFFYFSYQRIEISFILRKNFNYETFKKV